MRREVQESELQRAGRVPVLRPIKRGVLGDRASSQLAVGFCRTSAGASGVAGAPATAASRFKPGRR